VREGDLADTLFIIRRGTCVRIGPNGQTTELKENSYFGDKGLYSEKEVHSADIVVTSHSVTVLTITQRAFEEALGPLRRLMDDSRVHRESRASIIQPPASTEEIKKAGIAQEDELGQVITCMYNSSTPNLMLRGFLKSAVDELRMQPLISNYLDVARVVANSPIAVDCEIVPRLLQTYKENNGVFMLFKSPVVADLGSILADGTWNEEQIKNAAAHICVGLGILHQMGVVYRGLSSDLVYLDMEGNLVLCDYRCVCFDDLNFLCCGCVGVRLTCICRRLFCRVSKLGTERTYTLTGHSEYLAPEQVTQQGHNMAADFWALGVLMYEMRFGKTPFQSDSEVEILFCVLCESLDLGLFRRNTA
jgi:serine/threonine protein kinase